MNEDLKRRCFDIVCRLLNLHQIEANLIAHGVKAKNDDRPFRYFSLLNEVDLKQIDNEVRGQIESCYGEFGGVYHEKDAYLDSILMHNLFKLLVRDASSFSSGSDSTNFYNPQYIRPFRTIVLGLDYFAYGYDSSEKEIAISREVVGVKNMIQSQAISMLGVAVEVVLRDESYDYARVSRRL